MIVNLNLYFQAAEQNFEACVTLLLKANASVKEIKDNKGRSPWDLAKTEQLKQMLQQRK